MENLAAYLNDGVEALVRQALRSTLKNPKQSAFVVRYVAAAKKAAARRLSAENAGLHVPPFLIASIASQCNLFCSGCYARAGGHIGEAACASQLTDAQWSDIFAQAQTLGISFILLAGGEPMMRPGVLEAAGDYPDIVFPVFTNGTLLDETAVRLFDRQRNLVPVLSIEGDRTETDARRGAGVYDQLERAMTRLSQKGVLFGASITVTKENLARVTDPAYIDGLHSRGCKTVIFVEYVPVDGTATHTAPDSADRADLAARQDALRAQFDTMIFVAFPGDEEQFGGCLAAGRGFFHINPTGEAEPCPFSPFSDTNLKTTSLKQALASPLFRMLDVGGFLQGEHLGGCTLAAREDEIRALMASGSSNAAVS